MPSLSKGALLELREFIVDGRHGINVVTPVEDRLLGFIDAALDRGVRGKRLRRGRREEKAETRKDARAEIRARVVERADGYCEACRLPFTPANPGELDEFLGGFGRRQQMMAVETSWLIHATCHREKTDNRPNARTWICLFLVHCSKWGYTEIHQLVERRLEAR